jgi:molecular chaperone GrpE
VTDRQHHRENAPESTVHEHESVEEEVSAQEASSGDTAATAGDVVEADLQQQLAAAERRADEHLDDLRRLAAEFDNYRKRVARDHERLVAHANERLVKELLPVLDDLGRALEAAEAHEGGTPEQEGREAPPADGSRAELVAGVTLVHRALADVLRKQGLEEIPTDGAFDPHVHEALLAQPSEVPEGDVLEVLQKGYRLGDRVLRPARVVVSAGPAATG